ncbi:MAG: class I SAM-dependent methyltransferase [Anaerolineae bacterium]|nr:class I SAM-dependent methyltransferase [Caldilineales bacterium]MCX7853793.1 class I SAM-dependent methyltransferase [Caldilineales bacterium]MDW8269754.1 class I SAM-dependent methyltransferase [Anaerolineae bacterium]
MKSSTPMLVQIEEDRHWWFATRTRAVLALLDKYVGPGRNGRRVLDVGAGAGNMMHHLAHYGEVIGLEYHPKPIPIARSRGFDVRQGSATAIPFPDASFDLVALLDTIEHIPDEAAVLRETWRVTKPGGWLIVTVPALMWLWSQNDVLNQHQRRYAVPELRRKLTAVGWDVPFCSYTFTLIFPLSAALILARRRLGREPDLASPHFDPDAYQVEMEPAPPWLNALLDRVGRFEVALLKRTPLPIGTSIIAVAHKPEGRHVGHAS